MNSFSGLGKMSTSSALRDSFNLLKASFAD